MVMDIGSEGRCTNTAAPALKLSPILQKHCLLKNITPPSARAPNIAQPGSSTPRAQFQT